MRWADKRYQGAVRRATIMAMASHARLPLDLSLPQGVKPRRWMPVLASGLSIGEYARSLVRRLAFLSAVLVAAIWALDGRGYFWPAWAWLGLGDLVLLDFAAGWRQGRCGGWRACGRSWAPPRRSSCARGC
jgi:hypothetical protein